MGEQKVEQQPEQQPGSEIKTKNNRLSVFIGAVGNGLFGLMMVIVGLMVFSLVMTKISGGPPTIAGYRMYIVLSGSMNPAFDTGSLVFVKPSGIEAIENGDIITYRGLGKGEQLISHRVVSINRTENGIQLTTRGDANDADDPNPVTSRNLVGKVVLAIPYLGYFMNFSQSKNGIIILIIIPAALVLICESVNLYKNIKALKKERAAKDESQSSIV